LQIWDSNYGPDAGRGFLQALDENTKTNCNSPWSSFQIFA